MDEKNGKLEACPFCGGEAAFISDTQTIKCKTCGGAFICTNPLISRLEVAEAWNRRQQDTSTTKWIKSPSGEWICEKCRTTCCYEDKDGKTRPDKMGIRYCPRCGRRIINGRA